MIKHIVAVKLKNYEEMIKLEKEFIELKNDIPIIKEIIVNHNVYLKRETNYDLLFNVIFDTIEDMEAYLIHPIHVEFGKKLKQEYASNIMTIDLEI